MSEKLAIVTGGTRGIGAEISLALKDKGFTVVASYASNHDAAKAFSNIHSIKVMQWNVVNYNECINAVKQIETEFSTNVSILVNNAGITRDLMLHKMKEEDWHTVINTDLTSCFNMCSAVINQMRNQNYGRIVNISSINGQTGQLGQTNYAAAKAGVIGFTKSLALESAIKGITVNCVAPGYIKTEMVEKVSPEVLEKIISHIPVKRLGLPKDIARTVAFLVDEDSSFITGATFSINGGHNMY